MNFIEKFLGTATAAVIAWGIISYIEILTKNVNPGAVYSSWNMIAIIFGGPTA